MGIQQKVLGVGSHMSKISENKNACAYTRSRCAWVNARAQPHKSWGTRWLNLFHICFIWLICWSVFIYKSETLQMSDNPWLLPLPLKCNWASSAWNIWASVRQRWQGHWLICLFNFYFYDFFFPSDLYLTSSTYGVCGIIQTLYSSSTV